MAVKNYLDRLEIAYERFPAFEQQLLSLPQKWGPDTAYGWVYHIDPSLAQAKADTPSSSSEDIITIGNWRFMPGGFVGPNSPYKYNYKVEVIDCPIGELDVFGYIYYETYLLKRDKIYLRLNNQLLYSDYYWDRIKAFERDFGLTFVCISKADIAIDSTIDTSKVVYKLMRWHREIDWVVNGRRITDRNKTIDKLFWANSGSLNDPDRNRSLYVKQAEGLTLNAYNKTIEIVDKSYKFYQTWDWELDDEGLLDYVEDVNIFRNEIRLGRKNIINYIESHGIDDNQFREIIKDPIGRFNVFRELVRQMIRWNDGGKSHDITTLIYGGKVPNTDK